MRQSLRENPFVFLFGKTWKYAAGNRRSVVTFWLMFVAGNTLFYLSQPFLWAAVMNTIQLRGVTSESFPALLGLLGLTLVLEFVFWGFHGPARVLEIINAFRASASYRTRLLKGVMGLPLEWHVEHHSGDTIDKIEKGVGGLRAFSENTFVIVYSLVQLVSSYAVLAYESPAAAGIVTAMIGLTLWISMRFDRVLVALYRDENRMENRIAEGVFDAVSNIGTIVILRVERLVFETLARKLIEPLSLVRRTALVNEVKWFLVNVCVAVMVVAVLGLYFWTHLNAPGGVLVGTVYLLIQYLQRLSDVFFRFCEMYGEILQRKAKVANAEELAKDFTTGETFANHVLPAKWRELSIKNLAFSYEAEGTDLHLDEVSLTLRRGERIALIGETGSGKTTLLKLMRDLYHPRAVALSVDGKTIPEGFAGISRAIALVPQDPEIFATTIRENLTLGAEYDDASVRRFTDMACVTEVIVKLPHGFDSSIKEKGVNLSGGQKQRLALARGLLACHDKDIVLLDEPTSSLDALTEMQVYRNIFSSFDCKTIVSSVHRLHLLPLFDRIYLFENGKITAAGTLEELLASSECFIALWEATQAASQEAA